jgi:hypothetical protein
MAHGTKREPMIEIGTTVRVENGPARKTAVASKALLEDAVTAHHYAVGQKDAMGKVIVLGEPMTYLDYLGTWVWYVYQLEAVPIEDEIIERITAFRVPEGGTLTAQVVADHFGVPLDYILADPWRVKRFMPRGERAAKDEAMALAEGLED